jgi:glutathione S-transferase
MALSHKQIAYETIPWRFTEKAEIAPSGQKLVPVLVDGERWVADSWIIANYLEDTYPGHPSLFGDPATRALTRLYSNIADGLVGAIFPSRWTFWTTLRSRTGPISGRAGKNASACRLRPLLPIASKGFLRFRRA